MNKYQEYLNSKHWREFRTKILGERKICQNCSTRNGVMNIHHRNYECLGKEKSEDVLVLCQKCHNKFHSRIKWKKVMNSRGDMHFTGVSEGSSSKLFYNASDVLRKCRRCAKLHPVFYVYFVNGVKVLRMACPNSKPRNDSIPFEEIPDLPVLKDYRTDEKKLRQQAKRLLKLKR